MFAGISNATGLRILDLSANSLQHMPLSVPLLRPLEQLYLQNNSLKTLPDSLVSLSSLKVSTSALLAKLLLWDLYVHCLPWPHRSLLLPLMQILDLSRNKFTHIPGSLLECIKLESLNISHNRIDVLPSSLLSLSNLTQIFVHHNPIKGVPKRYVAGKGLRET